MSVMRSDCCVIAIEGLWTELCNNHLFASSLTAKFPAVKAVHATPHCTTVNADRQIIGRYNICAKKDFVSFAHALHNRLEIIYVCFCP
jgi:hypothetical protein